MTDYFVLLDQPRRPWLDPGAVKESFLKRAAEVHPDRSHSLGEAERAKAHEDYVALNAAHNCLRDPKSRLRHWLELERGVLPGDVQNIPSDLMDLSLGVGQACRDADALLAEKAKTSSPLLQVQQFERAQSLIERLQTIQHAIGERRDRLESELKALDGRWEATEDPRSQDRTELVKQIETVYRLFSFFGRWEDQLRERVARLSF